MVISRLEESPEGPMLLLSSRGSSRVREFDVTVRKHLPSDGNLFFSYVKSRTSGDLNDFKTLYGDRRSPILLDNENSLQPFDVPHQGPMLLLSSRGSSRVREFDVTVRKHLPSDGNLFFSYVKSRTSGDLNDFKTLYGDRRSPILLDNENSLQPFDVPHRLLLWGVINLPHGIAVVPGFEWRTGFPYTVFTAGYQVIGERNRGGRFPNFFSADLAVTKGLTVKGKSFRVGFQIFNLTGHYNPRDVYSNVASPNFGEFADSVDFSFRVRLGLDF